MTYLRRAVVMALTFPLIFTASPSPLRAQGFSEMPFFKVFDPNRTETWTPETDADMSITSFEGVALVKTRPFNRSWGALAKTVSVNLDQYPFLQIQVLSSTQRWYIILSGPQFEEGYVRLIETNKTGLFTFNIPEVTGVKGVQKFDVKIGISHSADNALADDSVSFDKLLFLSPEPSEEDLKKPKNGNGRKKSTPKNDANSLYIFKTDGSDVNLWQEALPYGPHEVRFIVDGGVGVIKGKMADRNWGALHRTVTVNLSATPILEINVVEVSKAWYLIAASPDIQGGYIRFIEGAQPGEHEFDFKTLTGLSGEATFDLQIGVSNPEGSTIKGELVAFNLLRFKKK